MATVQQIVALIRSHARGDRERFARIAEQMAETAAGRGQEKIAAEIRALLREADASAGPVAKSRDPIPMLRPRGELVGVMSVANPDVRLSDMVLDDHLLARLRKIVKEQCERSKLEARGLQPRRKFLLVGPPGTGKTMSTAAVATELGLPLFTILLDGLITKYMGETASKLRLVFDAMSERRAVYLFDEVDALATSRATDNDVGEARRILNSFLQFLDEDRSTSLVFAATNHPELLDRAIFRRFNASLHFELPGPPLVRPLVESVLSNFDLDRIDWAAVTSGAANLSQAEIVRAADDAARDAVLDHDNVVDTELLLASLADSHRVRPLT
ncbi:AAA family ATPase [Bradyrhizobium sp. Ec3.3]|uniref:AAA family ATPase n=1 Tax=Bradyrhizobium sp. Ec3.3 TaxID=189753 RepID=UPI0004109047|nr:ATP-binding protein [Bradyrhizobium sp. Ec3.3]